jgi:hypothetical protein
MERSRPRCEGRHEHFRCRRIVSERRVGPDDRNCAGQLLQGRHWRRRPERDQFPRVFAKVRIASFGDFAMGYENRVGLVLAKPLNEIVNVRRQAIFNVNAALENSESQVGTGRLLQSISACVPRLDCMSSLPGRVLINSRLNVLLRSEIDRNFESPRNVVPLSTAIGCVSRFGGVSPKLALGGPES